MRVTALFVMCLLLCGCATSVEREYNIDPPDVGRLIVRPPEGAMKQPAKAIPLKKGAPDAVNSGIMRDNNLSCSNDRAKLIILQDYIRTLFPKERG